MCVILNTYNNNTRIHIVKTRTLHHVGSKMLSRLNQTNKKNKNRTKRCLAWQVDEVRASHLHCKAQHATLPYLPVVINRQNKHNRHSTGIVFCFFFFICHIYPPFTGKRCIAMFWTVSPHSLGSYHFPVTCLPHKGEASR